MRRLACLVGAVLAATALAACGGSDEEEAAAPPKDATELSVKVTDAAAQPITMRLRCDGTCDVAKLQEMLRGAADKTRACTQQYGGPERAHVTGTVAGRPVDITLSRTDGCGIADYEALFVAFGREPPIAG